MPAPPRGRSRPLLGEDTAPPFTGLRCKSLEKATRQRAVSTLDVFLGALLENGRPLPPGFLITLPKVTSAAQVRRWPCCASGSKRRTG